MYGHAWLVFEASSSSLHFPPQTCFLENPGRGVRNTNRGAPLHLSAQRSGYRVRNLGANLCEHDAHEAKTLLGRYIASLPIHAWSPRMGGSGLLWFLSTAAWRCGVLQVIQSGAQDMISPCA